MSEANDWQNQKSSLSDSKDFSFISFRLGQDLSFSIWPALGLKSAMSVSPVSPWGVAGDADFLPVGEAGWRLRRALWEMLRDKPQAVWFGGGGEEQNTDRPQG